MPAMRSRISSSSSMIRMSRAILRLFLRQDGRLSGERRLCRLARGLRWYFGRAGGDRLGLARGAVALERQREGEARADAAVGIRFGIDQPDRAAVLLDDAGDDRKAQAGALLARRDVGLEQALPIFLGPALTV